MVGTRPSKSSPKISERFEERFNDARGVNAQGHDDRCPAGGIPVATLPMARPLLRFMDTYGSLVVGTIPTGPSAATAPSMFRRSMLVAFSKCVGSGSSSPNCPGERRVGPPLVRNPFALGLGGARSRATSPRRAP